MLSQNKCIEQQQQQQQINEDKQQELHKLINKLPKFPSIITTIIQQNVARSQQHNNNSDAARSPKYYHSNNTWITLKLRTEKVEWLNEKWNNANIFQFPNLKEQQTLQNLVPIRTTIASFAEMETENDLTKQLIIFTSNNNTTKIEKKITDASNSKLLIMENFCSFPSYNLTSPMKINSNNNNNNNKTNSKNNNKYTLSSVDIEKISKAINHQLFDDDNNDADILTSPATPTPTPTITIDEKFETGGGEIQEAKATSNYRIFNKTKDFNSRRRRGRLRSFNKVCQIVPAMDYIAKRLQILLSLLLSFVVEYVYIMRLLALKVTTTTSTTNTRKMTTQFKSTDKNSTQLKPGVKNKFNIEDDTLDGENINYISPPYNQRNSRSHFYHKTTKVTLHKRSSMIQHILYAFVFCIPLLLPCNNLLAAAAKPKSATHLKNQQQTTQHVGYSNDVALDIAGDNAGGGVGVPPTYQVIEDSEFLFPLQSEEQMFGHEVLDENEVRVDDDNISKRKIDNETHFENATKTPLFPKDLFSKEQLENGAVAFHIIGVIYMFVALAIVCDEFFVPSLDVIIEKLDITDDVAGATFMAAGGSAPELFTSVIGVFVSFDDVGIGTIVGSAVFNILFVIGMCALFSKTILTLTWWPLFRDCSFYSISLIVLIVFFRDNQIFWWEALILFTIYIGYVAFMKWNVQVESCVKNMIITSKVTRVRSTDQLMPAGNAANSSETSMATQPGGSVTSRAASETRSGPQGSSSAAGNSSGTQTGAKFRHGLLQLMIHTIDPLHDDDVPGKVDEKATQLHAIASLKVLLDATKPQRGGATTSAANHVKLNLTETTLADRPNGNIDASVESPSLSGRRHSWIEQRVKIQTRKFSIKAPQVEEENEPLSMAWPDTARKRFTYILVAPLLIPMWLTLPDTRTPRGKRFFPITFIGSILWIAAFSYLMVWWANVAGDTARIPPEVMGLTFLAAGTSIPDLITSVIVARKGFGDMAVSSSVGSNIFDVTVGLPVPWLLYGILYDAPVEVNSVGMVCSITILFMMLLFVVMSIAFFEWRMNKGLGFTMFLLYFAFVAVSLMFEYDIITCPV